MALFCERCGRERDANFNFCCVCGTPYDRRPAPPVASNASASNGFCAAIDVCWRKCFSFRGRAGYGEFFAFHTVYAFFAAFACLCLLSFAPDAEAKLEFWRALLERGEVKWLIWDVAQTSLWLLATFVGFWPALAVAVRRLHDTNRSGSYIFWFCFVPPGLALAALALAVAVPEIELYAVCGALVALILTLIGYTVLCVFLALPPTRGANKYGAPEAPSASVVGPCAAFDACLRRYCVFNGRSSRSEYWFFLMVYAFVWAFGAQFWMFANASTPADCLRGEVNFFSGIWGAALAVLFLPRVAASVRRLRDAGFSGAHAIWLLTAHLIAGVGLWAQINLSLFPKDEAWIYVGGSAALLLAAEAIFALLCLAPSRPDENERGTQVVEARGEQ